MPLPEILNVPPVEAVGHFRAKDYHVGFDWRDTEAETHLRSFTVAKAMRADILQDIRGAVDQAIAQGENFATFRERLQPLLQSKGWWGAAIRADPVTGNPEIVQLGSVHRLRTIFDTNIRTSYARGRWVRIQRVKDELPFLRYVAVQDERTRQQHNAWHGAVLPVDHAFWSTHYPPNGWFCRCIVQQLSEEDLERYGYQVSGAPPPGWNDMREWHNKRTGRVHQVPRGIDPGFAHNVGTLGSAESIAATVPGAADAVAKPQTLDEYILAGRSIREELVAAASGPASFEPARFRDLLKKKLARERDANKVKAELSPVEGSTGSMVAAAIGRDVRGLFPATWVRAANTIPVRVEPELGGGRGSHLRRDANMKRYNRPWSLIRASTKKTGHAQGTRVHEYVHHIQETMPGLDKLFQDLHKRRTAGEKAVNIYGPKERGRIDQYIEEYQGKEYEAGGALEMITMAYQYIFQIETPANRAYLRRLVKDDPEMLDLALGALFKYDD